MDDDDRLFDSGERGYIHVCTVLGHGCHNILFFISELLEGMQSVEEKQLGFGFVDDTNIITWGDSAQENCERLEEAHKKYEEGTQMGTLQAQLKLKVSPKKSSRKRSSECWGCGWILK